MIVTYTVLAVLKTGLKGIERQNYQIDPILINLVLKPLVEWGPTRRTL